MNLFLEACGASGPLLLGVGALGTGEHEARAFDLPFALVGRDPRSDVRLDNPEVSERHAYFQIVAGQLHCIDLGSRNGIYHGGRCRRNSYVERDQAVRIGPYRIRLLAGDAPRAAVDPESDEPAPALELSHRALRRSRCVLPEGLALVGSALDCSIRLIDPSVTNYHCSLIRTPKGVWIVDLLGVGGVRVNGQEIGYARLYEGDEVAVGQSVLRLSAGSEADRPPAPSAAPTPVEPPVVRNTANVPLMTSVALIPRAHEPERVSASDALQVAHATDLVDRIVAPLVQQFGMLQQQMVEEMNQARALMFDTFATLHQEQSAFLNHELEQLRQLSHELQTLRADLERQTRQLTEHVPIRLDAVSPMVPARTNGTHNRVVPAPRTTPEATAETADKIHAVLCDRISLIQQEQQSRWQKIMSLLPGSTPSKTPL